MGPILCTCFGFAINDAGTIERGLRNEAVGIVIALSVGLIVGFFASFCYPSDYRSEPMVERGQGMVSPLLHSFFLTFLLLCCSSTQV
jgi:hypothetical protein